MAPRGARGWKDYAKNPFSPPCKPFDLTNNIYHNKLTLPVKTVIKQRNGTLIILRSFFFDLVNFLFDWIGEIIMCPIVCSKFLEEYLLINRINREAIRVPEQLYQYLLENQTAGTNRTVPNPIVTLLRKVGFELNETMALSEVLLVRSIPKLVLHPLDNAS